MKPSVFISHSHNDKLFANYLASRLINSGARVWIDEAEIKVGESLITKISKAIKHTDFVIAVISRNSVKSKWVQKELSIAMTKEIEGKHFAVFPIKIDNCKMPQFLRDKLYCNFSSTKSTDWENQYSLLLRSLALQPLNNGTTEIQPLPLNLTLPAIMKRFTVIDKDCDALSSILAEDIWQDGIFIPSQERVLGRTPLEDTTLTTFQNTTNLTLKKGHVITESDIMPALDAVNIVPIKIRSVLTCSYLTSFWRARRGVCALCYGGNSRTGQIVQLGKDVGLAASKSILAAIKELKNLSSLQQILNPRIPLDRVILSPTPGVVNIEPHSSGSMHITVTNLKENTYADFITRNDLLVRNGAKVWLGQKLTKGYVDFQTFLDFFGEVKVRWHILNSLNTFFLSEGIRVHERDLEIIVALMTSYVRVIEYFEYEPEYESMKGKIISRYIFHNLNDQLQEKGKKHLIGQPVILGVDDIFALKPEQQTKSG